MNRRRKNTQSMVRKVVARIVGNKRGYVFTPAHFLDLGSRAAVDSALVRGVRAGRFRKLARGLNDLPHLANGVALHVACRGHRSC